MEPQAEGQDSIGGQVYGLLGTSSIRSSRRSAKSAQSLVRSKTRNRPSPQVLRNIEVFLSLRDFNVLCRKEIEPVVCYLSFPPAEPSWSLANVCGDIHAMQIIQHALINSYIYLLIYY